MTYLERVLSNMPHWNNEAEYNRNLKLAKRAKPRGKVFDRLNQLEFRSFIASLRIDIEASRQRRAKNHPGRLVYGELLKKYQDCIDDTAATMGVHPDYLIVDDA